MTFPQRSTPNYRQILSVEIFDEMGRVTTMFSLKGKPQEVFHDLLKDRDFHIPLRGTVKITSELKHD